MRGSTAKGARAPRRRARADVPDWWESAASDVGQGVAESERDAPRPIAERPRFPGDPPGVPHWVAGAVQSDYRISASVPAHPSFAAFRAGFAPARDVLVLHRLRPLPGLPGHLLFEAWCANPSRGESRGHAAVVSEEDVPEIARFVRGAIEDRVRRRFGWALRDNEFPAPPPDDAGWSSHLPAFRARADDEGEGLFHPDFGPRQDIYNTTLVRHGWAEFEEDFAPHLAANLPFDWRVIPASPPPAPDSGEVFPEVFTVEIWMAIPRRGADRIVQVHGLRRGDLPRMRVYLEAAARLHLDGVSWAAQLSPRDDAEGKPAA